MEEDVQEDVEQIEPVSSTTELTKLKHENSEIIQLLKKDLKASDCKWSLFVAASQSYRFDSCLRPFPQMFLNKDVKDINRINETLFNIPAFTLLERFLQEPTKYQVKRSAVSLLYWNLIQLNEPMLETVSDFEIDNVLNLVDSDLLAPQPNFIFKVKYGRTSVVERKWQAMKEGYNTMYAYHGSRLENFHSILNYGVQQHLNKNALFGQGIYLSSELLVSLQYSQNGCGWGKSILGPELSAVALCEMIDHPSINCQLKGEGDKSRATAKDSLAGEVPHKFYLVSNNDLVRVRYLLVYSRSPAYPYDEMRPRSIIGWFREHKVSTLLIGYSVMLATVGLSYNQFVQRCYKMICQKVGLYF